MPSSTHPLCDVKQNVKGKFREFTFSSEEVNEVLNSIFDKKIGEVVEKGLVDAQSVGEFNKIYKTFKQKWKIFGGKNEKFVVKYDA